MPVNRYFSVFFLCLHLGVMGQHKQDGNVLSLAERSLLQLILRDTTSSTICRLPKGMNFGIQNPDTGRLVLVKEKKINQLLLEGTNRVYVPDAGLKKGLIRIDSTFYTGDNFNFIAFRRRDTLFQYGGYGFWDTRDFFTWYRPWNHEWEIEVQTDYLQQLWTAYQYDPETDALFTMGRRFRGPFDDADQYVDSVYRFDFRLKRWATIGRIHTPLPWSKRSVETSDLIAHTPFGLLLRSGDQFVLADLSHNMIWKPSEALTKNLKKFNASENNNHDHQNIYIHLGDTLYKIKPEPGDDQVTSMQMRHEDFEPNPDQPHIYMHGTENIHWIPILIGILSILTVALIIQLLRQKKSSNTGRLEKNSPSESSAQPFKSENTSIAANGSAQIIDTSMPSDHAENVGFKEFIAHLNAVEYALIKSIVHATIEDQKMDIQRINEIIGVSQKPMAIQKARRSLVIHQINRTFSLTTGSFTELIRKERDMFQKRTYVYSADPVASIVLSELM